MYGSHRKDKITVKEKRQKDKKRMKKSIMRIIRLS
jgi:hypothetical protein